MKKCLYVTYDGLLDPLGQSQILPYIENLSENARVTDLDEDIEKLINQRSDINKQINEIIIADQTLVQDIKESGSNQDTIKQLTEEINQLNIDIKDLRKENSDLPSKKAKVGFFGSNSNEINNIGTKIDTQKQVIKT